MVWYLKTVAQRKNKNRTSGFSLMELILAVTIIGVFISIGLRIGNKVRHMADIAADKALLSCLALECNAVIEEGNIDLSDIKDMKDFAVALAKAGGPNDISSYQSKKRRNQKHMEIIVDGNQNIALKNADFDFIAVKPNNNPTGRDVLFCTRGLQKGGKWDGKDNLYGHEGGLIVFRDGHTQFCSENKDVGENLIAHSD